MWYYIILYYIILYYVILYYIILYYIILYYIILYYIILYYIIMLPPSYLRSVVYRNVVMRRISVHSMTFTQRRNSPIDAFLRKDARLLATHVCIYSYFLCRNTLWKVWSRPSATSICSYCFHTHKHLFDWCILIHDSPWRHTECDVECQKYSLLQTVKLSHTDVRVRV